MMFVDYILQWARDKGYAAVYGSPEQVNEMLTNVPFAGSQDGTAVIMHLVADSETVDGHDRAIVAVYFASLCPFDFNGESLLTEQERLKNIGKDLLNDIRTGNTIAYEYPRWQYGYDDYAENVCWVCLRVTLTALAADCVPLPMPTIEVVSVPAAVSDAFTMAGFTPETHGDIVSTSAGGYVFFGSVIVYTENLGEQTVTITVNGTEIPGFSVYSQQIDSDVTANLPSLSPYEGQYYTPAVLLDNTVPYQSGTYTVTIKVGDVWTTTAIWEEVI